MASEAWDAEDRIRESTKEKAFTNLCNQYGIGQKVKALIMDSPMQTLADFQFWFANRAAIDAWVAGAADLPDGSERQLQASRVAQAWTAVNASASKAKEVSSDRVPPDLDDLLEDTTLREVKQRFWKRHKLTHPPEIAPGDQLVSRCFRELDKGMLTVYNLWTVKDLMHQISHVRKRKQVGIDLYLMQEDGLNSQVHAKSVPKYLSLMYTYFLALAMAGSNRRPNAGEESMGGDPTKMVAVPWEVLMKYYWRACRTSQSLPERNRLSWLEKADTEERAEWVTRFRAGEQTLGEIVSDLMDRRAAHWYPPPASGGQLLAIADQPYQVHGEPPEYEASKGARRGAKKKRRLGKTQAGSKGKGKGSKGKNHEERPWAQGQQRVRLANTLKDGSTLCQAWQRNTCQQQHSDKCPRGLHRCAKITQSGRVCGMNGHIGTQCTRK